MEPGILFIGGVQLLILLLGLSVHESAHAWTALRCGDTTARDLGRLTLNPFRHLDPMGSLLIPGLLVVFGMPVFGWARPTPVVLDNLRDPRRDDMLVTLAGPVANFLLFSAATVVLVVAVQIAGPPGREAAQMAFFPRLMTDLESPHVPLMFTLVQLAFINAFLGMFHLIPIPPLDGGRVLLALMPPEWAVKYAAVERFGYLIVMVLGLLGALTVLIMPIYVFLYLLVSL